MYDDNGLICCGLHMTTDALRGDNLARTIEFNRILGNRFLIVAWDQPRMSSVAGGEPTRRRSAKSTASRFVRRR